MKINRKQLMEILGVKNSALKQIIRKNQLSKRLNEKGYELLKEYKEGRKTTYEIKEINNSKKNKLLMVKLLMFIFLISLIDITPSFFHKISVIPLI